MDIEWSNISNNLFISYGVGALIAVVIIYILKSNQIKKIKK